MDKKEIIWSENAKKDLGKIWDHVAKNFTQKKAIEITTNIMSHVSKLASFPRAGSVSRDFPEIRELVIDGNVVFYRILDSAVLIATVRPRRTNLKLIK